MTVPFEAWVQTVFNHPPKEPNWYWDEGFDRERVACIQAMTKFFRDFVMLAAPGPEQTQSNPFHGACYMWWDLLWHTFTSGGRRAVEPELHRACLKVLTEVLDLPSELCRLSALHGLNHWHGHYGEQVEGIIDAFLAKTGDITPSIREYAANARAGLCQ